jgi:hypothetical protein
MDQSYLRQRAEEVRAELSTLIPDEEERGRVEAELADALTQPPGDADGAILRVLRSHQAVLDWLRTARSRATSLVDQRPPQLGVLYVCPNKDYSVVPEGLSDQALLCPHCDSVLQPYHP